MAALLLLTATAIAYATFSGTFGAFGSDAKAAPAATGAPGLSVGVVSGAAGLPVDVPLRLAHAAGLGSASVVLTYDPDVVVVRDVRAGDVPQSALAWHHDEQLGAIVMLLTTSLANGATGSHAFAHVVLEARDGAVGAVSPLELVVRSAASARGESYTLDAASGTFRNGVPGDVLGDGIVDKADYEQLAAYLVGKDVVIVELNADLDGDGAITGADAVRLHQYLDGARASP